MKELTPEFDVIRDAVALACRAPSLHNSQPWRWIADGPTLHLFADPTRLMFAADPQGREITLSCGAALDHLIVAMSAAGWETTVARFPDPYEPFHVATIDFRPARRRRPRRGVLRAPRRSRGAAQTGVPSALQPTGPDSKCCCGRHDPVPRDV